ncbi:hypothetical protein GUV62_18900 [Stenotrophomonas maltophilia]|uniref:hypothetical protein n=1 Tax=Stenotrophomonas maltophilia TaxID=40324 RepID=UPI001F2ECDB6|nr:hypothetical protein [Stenotrophomonas maltophilia]MCF3494294.1 hypothetical protein [Stenotrophomonas maltophilia]MCF3514602.1 hypothetical protein [Stenotrophomonas maltophilia]
MSKHTALRLVDTRSLDRQQWLEVRNGGIGSSDEDVPAVVEEFYPSGHGEVVQATANVSLKDRLEAQTSRLAS